MLAEGRGIARDYVEAAKWLRRSAEQGSAWAKVNLGLLYENGTGVPKSEAEARSLYRQAANEGNGFAKAQLQRLERR